MADQLQLDQLIMQAGTIAVSGHEHPDGDCAGSVTGLYHYIKNVCPQSRVDVYLEKIPDAYGFIGDGIPIRGLIDEDVPVYDLFISLDCGEPARLGFSRPVLERAKKTACIDHHISNTGFADVNLINPDASSTSEMLAGVMSGKYMDAQIARSLFLGIVHDTGVFQYPSTSPDTHRIAADLLEYGFDASDLITVTYYEKTLNQQRICARAIENARLMLDGKVIVSTITQEEMAACHVLPEHLDGIVAQMRDTAGVECAVFLYERKKGQWKVSLRARRYTDMRLVAQAFGGGGHRKAAGVTFDTDDPEYVIDQITAQIRLQLEEQ